MFALVSYLLYAVYALFILLALTHFGDRIGAGFAQPSRSSGWLSRRGRLRQL